MKYINTMVLVVILTISVPFAAAGTQSRTALIIGNADYQESPLKNPVNDAWGMATVLKKKGFGVTLKLNANQETMERAIRDFGTNIRKGGIGLFYFAGHGVQVHGNNYLIPVGSIIETEYDVKYEAVDAGLVLAKMEDAGNDMNIVILDACRNNPYARSFSLGSTTGLARMDAPKGSLVAYATAPGSVAADGDGENGIYTKHLIRNIEKPGMTVENVLKNVRIAVASETGSKQIPWESSSLMGPFYFTSDATPEPWSEKQIMVTAPGPGNTETRIAAKAKPKMWKPETKTSGQRRFHPQTSGTVLDQATGLEWYAGKDIQTTWDEAEQWVSSLGLNGGGWRMPTVKELKAIYEQGKGTRNMPPGLRTTGWFIWSGEQVPGEPAARGFDFSHAQSYSYDYGILDTSGDTTWYDGAGSTAARGFAVRRQSTGTNHSITQ